MMTPAKNEPEHIPGGSHCNAPASDGTVTEMEIDSNDDPLSEPSEKMVQDDLPTQKEEEYSQTKSCYTFAISFVKSAVEAPTDDSEMSMIQKLIVGASGICAGAIGAYLEFFVAKTTPGGPTVNSAKAGSEIPHYLFTKLNDVKQENRKIQIENLIRRIQSTQGTEYDQYIYDFQCFFGALAVDIFFHFEDLIKEYCNSNKETQETETIFGAMGNFAGRACYYSCKNEKGKGKQEILKSFVSISRLKNFGNALNESLGFAPHVDKKARKIFTKSIPAYFPLSEFGQHYSQVKYVVVNSEQYSTKSKLRPPFEFEQMLLIDLLESGTGIKNIPLESDHSKFRNKKDKEMLAYVLGKILNDETLNLSNHWKDFMTTQLSKQTLDINSHTTQKVNQLTNVCVTQSTKQTLDLKSHTTQGLNQLKEVLVKEIKQSPEALKSDSNQISISDTPVLLSTTQPRNLESKFQGRHTELDTIHKDLQNCKDKIGNPMVIITGLGGIGKTATVRKYTEDRNNVEDFHLIIKINSESFASLKASFLYAAENLMGRTWGNINEGGDEEWKEIIISLAKTMYSRLSSIYKPHHVLFIFENTLRMKWTDKEFGVEPFIPKEHYAGLFVLVTSQNRIWDSRHTQLHINELNEIEQTILLKNLGLAPPQRQPPPQPPSPNEKLNSKIQNLEELLKGYPLAITTAAAYIHAHYLYESDTAQKITNYIKDFESSNSMLAFESDSDESGYSKNLMTVLNVAIKHIENQKVGGDKALDLLHLMSYLAPQSISQHYCNLLFDSENEQKQYAKPPHITPYLAKLRNMSLLETKIENLLMSSGKIEAVLKIQLHRLVQKIIRERYKGEVDKLNQWFRPRPSCFLPNFAQDHVSHVLESFCSTYYDMPKIPILAILSMYSEFRHSDAYGVDSALTNMNRRIKRLLSNVQGNPCQKIHNRLDKDSWIREKFILKEVAFCFLYHIVSLTDTDTDPHNEHVLRICQVMTHNMDGGMDAMFLQYTGIEAITHCGRPLTQVEAEHVGGWIEFFLKHEMYTNHRESIKLAFNRAVSSFFDYMRSSRTSSVVAALKNVEALLQFSNSPNSVPYINSKFFEALCREIGVLFRNDFDVSFESSVELEDVPLRKHKIVDNIVCTTKNYLQSRSNWGPRNYLGLWEICDIIDQVSVSRKAEYASKFRSSESFMKAFMECSNIIAKEKLERRGSDAVPLIRVAGSLISIFANVSDDYQEKIYLDGDVSEEEKETAVKHVVDTVKANYIQNPGYPSKSDGFFLPINTIISFLGNHEGKGKDDLLTRIAIAIKDSIPILKQQETGKVTTRCYETPV